MKNVQRTILMMGRKTEAVDACSAGNTCGIVGIDQYIVKLGTFLINSRHYTFLDEAVSHPTLAGGGHIR